MSYWGNMHTMLHGQCYIQCFIHCCILCCMADVSYDVTYIIAYNVAWPVLHYSDGTWSSWHLKSPTAQLFNILFRLTTKKISKALHYWPFCEWNPPVTGGFHSQRASNVDNISLSWGHPGLCPILASHSWLGVQWWQWQWDDLPLLYNEPQDNGLGMQTADPEVHWGLWDGIAWHHYLWAWTYIT